MENESKSEWKITSIGAVCANRWSICMNSGFDYIGSPVDNVDNQTKHQFENIIRLMKSSFSIISRDRLDVLEYNVLHNHKRIDLGVYKTFYGYNYIGDELYKPFILTHFFDSNEKDRESFESGWSRWEHKAASFMDYIQDQGKKIIMVNLRVFEELEDERRQILKTALEFEDFLKSEYGRSAENTVIVNYIITMADGISFDHDDPMFCQIVVPEDPNEINLKFWERSSNFDKYVNILKDVVLKPRGITN